MCQGGCKGDCGCGQISTTKGEKGDRGANGTNGVLMLPKYALFESVAVTTGSPVNFNYTLVENGTFVLQFECSLLGSDANLCTSSLYKNAVAQSSNINYRHRLLLPDDNYETFTHTAVVTGIAGDVFGFQLSFNGNFDNGSMIVIKA